MMKVIGLAGRAGSGKSTVAQVLARQPGIEWIDLDRVAWQTYAKGTTVHRCLVEAFGERILNEAGEVDRRLLADSAFADVKSQRKLDAIVHPAVGNAVLTLIRRHQELGTDVLIIEGALLASSPYVDRSIYDRVLWLDVSEEDRAKRLQDVGRGDHARRGRDVSPSGVFTSISSHGTVDEVAERCLRAIDGDPG